jgi:ACS family tartrate transporter-like MFS transporter
MRSGVVPGGQPSDVIAERALRRISLRVMPYVFLLYIVAFLDRVNVGYAALQMAGDLGFSAAVFGFGAGIFFFGYVILEIPGSVIVERWSARKWIARIMISWGILAIMMAFVKTATQFYSVRFLLGAAEAGFFPGLIVYLSHWFRYQDRAKAVAWFMAAIPISNLVGSPISGLLLGVHWLNQPGWRWLFIVEGVPAIILGFTTLVYLTDWPREAKWLPDDEKQWIIHELETEKQQRKAAHPISMWQALRHRDVLLLVGAYFFATVGFYGLNIWLPTILKGSSGWSDLKVTMVAMIPHLAGLGGMLAFGASSDRTGERRWHAAGAMLLGAAGYVLVVLAGGNPLLVVAAFCIVAAGADGYFPGFWPLPTAFLTESAAAAAIGLINSFGNLGGFVGPYILGYVRTATNSFDIGLALLAVSMVIGAACVLSVRHAAGDGQRK